MTTADNELSNQKFKKLRATKGVSNITEKNVAGDLNAGTALKARGTATVQGKVFEIPSRSYQTEGQLQNLSCRNADMKESTHVTGQFEPSSFVCHPSLAIQEARNATVAIPSHSHHHVPLQQFSNWNSPLSNLSNNSPSVNTQVSKTLSLFVTSVLNIDIKDCFNMVTTTILVGRSMLDVPINCQYVICGPSFCSAYILTCTFITLEYFIQTTRNRYGYGLVSYFPSEINVWSTKLSHKALLHIINVLSHNLCSLACGFETSGKRIATH